MASLLVQAFKGVHAEVLQEQGALERLRKLRQLAGVFAAELGTAAGLTPYCLRSLRVKTSVPVAGSPAADASPYGVVLHPAVPYGPKPRHLIDIYVPSHVYEQLQDGRLPSAQQQQQQLVPVIFFCHGGIWATGDRWHFGPMAVSLAQAGAVVAVISYSLYPEALASEMAGEVLAALVWTCQEIGQFGGDAARISVVGHSAGGHLGALAVMMLAQQRQQALEAAAAATAAVGQLQGVSMQQQQQQQQQRCKHPQGQAGKNRLQQQLSAQQQQGADLHRRPQQQQASQQQQRGQHQQQQLLQQLRPQGQRRQRQPLWYIPDPLTLPQPLLFVGMSSVYDVGLHFEFESMRGVAGISTMARACGGEAMFDAVSPAVLLKQAAAERQKAAGSVAAAMQPRRSSNQQQLLQPVQWPQLPAGAAAAAAASYHFTPAQLGSRSLQRFTRPSSGGLAVTPGADDSQPQQQLLHGEVISIRIGMQPPRAVSSSSLASAAAAAPSQTSGTSSSSSSSSQQAGGTSFGDAATLLRGFSVAYAAQLPPFVVMSSCGDHMVPWHEGADMTLALQACGVPAKHLIYDRYLHNDFVLDWSPAVVRGTGAGGVVAAEAAAEQGLIAPAAAAAAAAGGGVAEVGRATVSGSGAGRSSSVNSMPAFAQDLISMVTGRVQLQFSCSKAAADQAAETGGSKSGAAAAGSGSGFRMGPWFAVQPHSRL